MNPGALITMFATMISQTTEAGNTPPNATTLKSTESIGIEIALEASTRPYCTRCPKRSTNR